MALEIERKFLVNAIPSDLTIKSKKTIYQSYLAVGNEEIRIRALVLDGSSFVEYSMTIKKGTGLSREEIEFSISRETYNQLCEPLLRRPLIKVRQKIIDGNYIFDLDTYCSPTNDELVIVEVEFTSEEEANAFISPSWFSTEVTGDIKYKNQSLWSAMRPNVNRG